VLSGGGANDSQVTLEFPLVGGVETVTHHSPGLGDQLSRESSAQSRLVIETVLSIIQNYYVEFERVSLETLRAGFWSALSETFSKIKMAGPEAKDLLLPSGSLLYQQSEVNINSLVNEIELISLELSLLQQDVAQEKLKSLRPSMQALSVLVSQLDAHSTVMNPESYQELKEGTEGVFGGLGIMVGIKGGLLTVIKPIDGAPAKKMGIKRGDRIIEIADHATFGLGLEELVYLMRGSPGTAVNLVVLRPGEAVPRQFEVNREVINLKSVDSRYLQSGDHRFLHVAIDAFTHKTASELLNVLSDIELPAKGKDLSGLILDLRANPGGLLDQAVVVADIFLNDGTIVSTEGRRREIESARSDSWHPDIPMAILIDSDTASASEIVAGALQDHNRAIVVGQPSFGKGSVQTIFELPEQVALKLTVARYFTPSRQRIQGHGIMPDILMTPIYPTESNINIFGTSRFRTERFLKNHLLEWKSDQLRRPAIEFCYLKSSLDRDMENEAKSDGVLEGAIHLVEKFQEFYSATKKRENFRASHLLGVIQQSPPTSLVEKDLAARQKLDSDFQISWPALTDSTKMAEIKLSSSTKQIAINASNGRIKMPIMLSNLGASADQVSLVIRSEKKPSVDFEYVIGNVKANTNKEINVGVNLPNYIDSSVIDFHVVAMQQGLPLAADPLKFHVFIGESERPKLDLKVQYVELDQQGIPDYLEPEESAYVEITLLNNSEYDINKLLVNLSNFAGSQIKLSGASKEIEKLSARKQKMVKFKIEGTKEINNLILHLGASVHAETLGGIVRAPLQIKGSNRVQGVAH
jgi:carboxyl-terminal processing protease